MRIGRKAPFTPCLGFNALEQKPVEFGFFHNRKGDTENSVYAGGEEVLIDCNWLKSTTPKAVAI